MRKLYFASIHCTLHKPTHRQRTYNVRLRRVRVTIAVVAKLRIKHLGVSVFLTLQSGLSVTYYIVICGLSESVIFFHIISQMVTILHQNKSYRTQHVCFDLYNFFFYWRYNPLWVRILQPSSGAIVSSRTRFLDHTQRHATVGRTPLDE